jgi:hypothetical protein
MIEYKEGLAGQVETILFPNPMDSPVAQDPLFVRLFGNTPTLTALQGDEEYLFYQNRKRNPGAKKNSNKLKKPVTLKQGRNLRPVEKVAKRAQVEAMHLKIKQGWDSDSDSDQDATSIKRQRTLCPGDAKVLEDLAATFSVVDV